MLLQIRKGAFHFGYPDDCANWNRYNSILRFLAVPEFPPAELSIVRSLARLEFEIQQCAQPFRRFENYTSPSAAIAVRSVPRAAHTSPCGN